MAEDNEGGQATRRERTYASGGRVMAVFLYMRGAGVFLSIIIAKMPDLFSQKICVLAFDDLGVVLNGLCSVYVQYHRDRINPTSIIVEVRND